MDGSRIRVPNRRPLVALKSATLEDTFMGGSFIKLSFISDTVFKFVPGDFIIFEGVKYTNRSIANRERIRDNIYQYDLTFFCPMFDLMKCICRNTDVFSKSSTSDFYLTCSIDGFIKIIINNLNRDYSGLWVFDEKSCPYTEPKTLNFSRNNCLQVLQTVCKEFNLEFRIDYGKNKHLIKIGKFGWRLYNQKTDMHSFEVGKGKGLYKIREDRVDDKAVITRIWAEGSTKNIATDYRDGSERLQLPYPKRMNMYTHMLSDGTIIAPSSMMIGVEDEERRYVENERISNIIGVSEDAVLYDDIYPHRKGVVTKIDESDIYSFFDDTMDFNLNEKNPYVAVDLNSKPNKHSGTKWLIPGVSAKINFITGKLAGQTFELRNDPGYNHKLKKFTILPFKDERGVQFPTKDSTAFRISKGDRYTITDIFMPKEYIDKAEEELYFKAYNELKERSQPKARYTLSLDRMYFKSIYPNGSEIVVFRTGDFIPVVDKRFGIDKLIRIQKVSRNLLHDYDYQLTLSDDTAVSITTQNVIDIIDHEKIINNNKLRDPNKIRQGWRSTEELKTLIFDPDGYFDVENIKPNSIETNMLAVGTKSGQFILNEVRFEPNCNGDKDTIRISDGSLIHYAIKDKPYEWSMRGDIIRLTSDRPYYLYAVCNKEMSYGLWIVSTDQFKVEDERDPYNYFFLTAIIGSVMNNWRDFNTTYGFSRINGGCITTGVISSADGATRFDLDRGEMYGRINFRDGIISGDIQVGNDTGANAGLSGEGDAVESIRFYAGTSKKNKANAPFRVQHNGKVVMENAEVKGVVNATSGSFHNVVIYGSNRSPFKISEASNITPTSDCISYYSNEGSWVNARGLPWSIDQGGRRIILMNYKWNGRISYGRFSIGAPNGKYFFIDGKKQSELTIKTQEYYELLGYGDESQFYGWIVMQRRDVDLIGYAGKELKVIAMGTMTEHGTYQSLHARTFDGSEMSASRLDTGKYKVTIPSEWFQNIQDMDDYLVFVTGLGFSWNDKTPLKASVQERNKEYFIVDTSDDSTRNSGSFMFMVINAALW